MSAVLTVLEGIGWYVASSFAFGAVLALLGFIRNSIRRSPR